ncbi:MAG: ABC transporter permease [Oscillospiraceae bacterium]|nr:ABC transporter permease [Oscillospiraceae bacterium]
MVDNSVAVVPTRKRFHLNRRAKTIVISAFIGAIIVAVFVSGMIITDDMVAANFAEKNLPPSFGHLFGTDWLGRDMFLRTIKGLSISITVGTVASAASAVIATIIGIIAATGSRWLDSFINWFIDLVMGVPHLVLLILISFVCGKGLTGLLVGITCTHWCSLARLIRAEVLQIRTQQYIGVSRRLGHSSGWILIHHILPHMVPQFIIGIVLLFPHAILHESSLSFLGFGLPPEQPAVGIILAESMKYLSSGMWWLAVFPGALLVLIVVLFEKLGDNLKTIVDPYSANE